MRIFQKITRVYPLYTDVTLIERPSLYVPLKKKNESVLQESLADFFSIPSQDWKRDSIARARRLMRRSVLANLDGTPCSFITQTFNYEPTLKDAWRANTLFFQRLRNVSPSLRYVSVLEVQPTSRRFHFHSLVFCPKIFSSISSERSTRYLANIWGHGFLDALRTDSSPALAGYLSKYLTKSDLPKGARRYSVSRNTPEIKVTSEVLRSSDWADTLAVLGTPAWRAPSSGVLGEIIGYRFSHGYY